MSRTETPEGPYDYELEDQEDQQSHTPGRLRRVAVWGAASALTLGVTYAGVKAQDHEADRVDPTKSGQGDEGVDPAAPYADEPGLEMGGREETPEAHQ